MKNNASILLAILFIVSSEANSEIRRQKRQAPVECIYTPAGGSWLDECNWCRCSVRGVGLCTKRGCSPDLAIRLEQETKQCSGQIRWKRDCNWCECVNERAICTEIFCGEFPQQQTLVAVLPNSAIPRSTAEKPERSCNYFGKDTGKWRKECNWCGCSETGVGACTRKGCPEVIVAHVENEPDCEGKVEWKRDGVWYKCVDGTAEPCASDFCEAVPRTATRTRTQSAAREKDCRVGTGGGRWRHECNWCRCGEEEMGFCTRRGCPEALALRLQNEPACEGNIHWKQNETWYKCVEGKAVQCVKDFCDETKPNPELDDVFGREDATCAIISEVGGWSKDCNWCRCIRGRAQCTRRACDNTVQASDPSLIRDTVLSVEKQPKCSGRIRWKQDCNWCECVQDVGICSANICEKDVKEAVKRELACVTGPDGGFWKKECNRCNCRDGFAMCTKKGCRPNAPRTEPVCSGEIVWKKGCNWCRCENGVGICTTRSCGAVSRALEESSACEEGQTWVEGCNTCFCNGGRSLCTRRACLEDLSHSGIEPATLRSEAAVIADLENSKALESVDCVEGSRWKRDCNWCGCAGGGVAVCTLRGCLPGFELKSDEPLCEQGSQWKEDCNICSCINGLPVCSKKSCDTSDTKNAIEETPQQERKFVWPPPGNDCKAGSNWKEDCNWCRCLNGVGFCTRMLCFPEPSEARPECRGNSEWRRDEDDGSCSWCVCENDAGVCEPSECAEDTTEPTTVAKPAVRARLIPGRVQEQEPETCTEGSRWRVDCNWCTCRNGVGACTAMACLPGRKDPFEGACEGNSRWKKDCNWCSCIDGKASCTEIACKSTKEEQEQVCIDGNSWVEDCNVCMCSKNVAVCTLRACLPQPRTAADGCKAGESWKEDCNFCSCVNGLSACTRMRCLPPEEYAEEAEPLPRVCSLPAIEPDAQLCGGFEPKWTFNSEFELCEEIAYGGCGGTENLYNTEDECLTTCSRQQVVQTRAEIRDPRERCYLQQSTGPCFGSLSRYSFNPEVNRCELFYYGGCQGNQNNFFSLNECVSVCGGNPPVLEETCDRSKCNWKRYDHYLAKDCRPVYEGGACCPTSFDCRTEAERGLLSNRCYYKGKEYQPGENVPVDDECSRGCRCVEQRNPERVAEISCANVECPSLFAPPEPGCRNIYQLGKCCSVSKDCTVQETETRSSGCSWKGKTWKFGDKMYFDDEPCQKCVCSEDFTDPKGPGCKKVTCGYDFRYRNNLVRGYTPLFFEENCCPIGWLSPGDERFGDVIQVQSITRVRSSEECVAGDLVVPLGASVAMSDCHIRCSCETPPELTCVRYRSCELAEAAATSQKQGDCPALDCPSQCTSKLNTETGCPKCFCENMKYVCQNPTCPPACLNPSIEFDASIGCKVCKCQCRTDPRGEPHCPMDCRIRKYFDRESGCTKCECDQSVPQIPYA